MRALARLAAAPLAVVAFLAAPALAQDAPRSDRAVRIVEDVPALHIAKRVSADASPSGLPVPRHVSLKHPMNCRQGPSRAHRALWRYRRTGLPLVVVAETEFWRRVRDVNGDSCWMLGSGLSGRRGALVLADMVLARKPRADAPPVARVDRGAVLALGECADGWCRVEADTPAGPRKGWSLRRHLWGAQPL